LTCRYYRFCKAIGFQLSALMMNRAQKACTCDTADVFDAGQDCQMDSTRLTSLIYAFFSSWNNVKKDLWSYLSYPYKLKLSNQIKSNINQSGASG